VQGEAGIAVEGAGHSCGRELCVGAHRRTTSVHRG
jgi:hypothetical protein